MIHRKPIDFGEVIEGPRNVTFGWQSERSCFSIWFRADEEQSCKYRIVATGSKIDGELAATVVMPNGFHVFHLIRIANV